MQSGIPRRRLTGTGLELRLSVLVRFIICSQHLQHVAGRLESYHASRAANAHPARYWAVRAASGQRSSRDHVDKDREAKRAHDSSARWPEWHRAHGVFSAGQEGEAGCGRAQGKGQSGQVHGGHSSTEGLCGGRAEHQGKIVKKTGLTQNSRVDPAVCM